MPRPCDHPTGPPSPSCHICKLWLTRADYRALWGGPAVLGKVHQHLAKQAIPCVHLGEATGRKTRCAACGQHHVEVDVHGCAIHGECTTHRVAQEKLPCCARCPDRDSDLHAARMPHRVVRIALSPDGYNPSIIEYDGRTLLCFRRGRSGSDLYLCEMGKDGYTSGERRLSLRHHLCAAGREDPRLWRHADRLHVSFSGVQLFRGQTLVHQMIGRFNRDATDIEDVYCPDYPHRAGWEKNWGFFEAGGLLYAVYEIRPHRMLAIRHGRAEEASRRDWSPRWSGGLLRGGAAPVRVGDLFFAFFHGALDRRPGGRIYSIGCYAFDATPPFEPVLYTPRPILLPSEQDRPADMPHASVVFPGGAVLRDGRWQVVYGLHDAWSEVMEFSHSDLLKEMVSV